MKVRYEAVYGKDKKDVKREDVKTEDEKKESS